MFHNKAQKPSGVAHRQYIDFAALPYRAIPVVCVQVLTISLALIGVEIRLSPLRCMSAQATEDVS